MSAPVSKLAKRLVDASMEFYARAPWERALPDALFMVRIPGEDHPWTACLMGQGGAEFGAFIFRGARSHGQMANLVLTGDGSPLADTMDLVSISFSPEFEIEGPFRKLLKSAGFKIKRNQIAPQLMIKPPGQIPRVPKPAEMKQCLWFLEGLRLTDEAGSFEPRQIESVRSPLPLLEPGGIPEAPTCKLTREFIPPVSLEILPNAFDFPKKLIGLPRLNESWHLVIGTIPGTIDGEEEMPRTMLTMRVEDEFMLDPVVFLGLELKPCFEHLLDLFYGRTQVKTMSGVPQRILLDGPELNGAFAQGLIALGLSVEEAPFPNQALSALMGVFEDPLEPYLEEGLQDLLGISGSSQFEGAQIEDWLEADRLVVERFIDPLLKKASKRSRLQFFGDEEFGAQLLQDPQGHMAREAYSEWIFAEYRATSRSNTALEKAFSKTEDSERESALLAARDGFELAPIRIEAINKDGTLDVSSPLFDGLRPVIAPQWAQPEHVGQFVPVRVLMVGQNAAPLIKCAGPMIAESALPRLLEHLEEMRAKGPANEDFSSLYFGTFFCKSER